MMLRMNGLSWKRMGIVFSGLLVVLPACGGDDDDEGSGARAPKCAQVCDDTTAAGCGLFEPAECKQICEAFAGLSASCASAGETLAQCQLDGDVCNPDCDDEELALSTACM